MFLQMIKKDVIIDYIFRESEASEIKIEKNAYEACSEIIETITIL